MTITYLVSLKFEKLGQSLSQWFFEKILIVENTCNLKFTIVLTIFKCVFW